MIPAPYRYTTNAPSALRYERKNQMLMRQEFCKYHIPISNHDCDPDPRMEPVASPSPASSIVLFENSSSLTPSTILPGQSISQRETPGASQNSVASPSSSRATVFNYTAFSVAGVFNLSWLFFDKKLKPSKKDSPNVKIPCLACGVPCTSTYSSPTILQQHCAKEHAEIWSYLSNKRLKLFSPTKSNNIRDIRTYLQKQSTSYSDKTFEDLLLRWAISDDQAFTVMSSFDCSTNIICRSPRTKHS